MEKITLSEADLSAARELRADLGQDLGATLAILDHTLESLAAGHLTPTDPMVRTAVAVARSAGAEILDAGARAGYRSPARDDTAGW